MISSSVIHRHPVFSGLDLVKFRSKLPLEIRRFKETNSGPFSRVRLEFGGISGTRILPCYCKCRRDLRVNSAAAGRDPRPVRFDDKPGSEPFGSGLIKEAFWSLRSLLVFLVEQPGQLRYIEWPSFKSTLKTATLTLVLVAILIVVLSSIDSALSYLLALFLRRPA